jgi:hypothetical protein
MKIIPCLVLLCAAAFYLTAAEEKPVNFIPAKADPIIGDWQGKADGYVAQVYLAEDGKYQANLLKQFDAESNVVAVLPGRLTGETVLFEGGGWSAKLAGKNFKGSHQNETFDLQPVTRTPPTLGAKPPPGAVTLFDGSSMDA